MIILDSILLFQVLEFICLTYFVLLIIPRNSHERQATQCFTLPRISPIKEDGDTVEIIVDCWSKYRVKVRKNRRFFVCYVFFPLGGRKGGEELERGTRNYRVQAFSMPGSLSWVALSFRRGGIEVNGRADRTKPRATPSGSLADAGNSPIS